MSTISPSFMSWPGIFFAFIGFVIKAIAFHCDPGLPVAVIHLVITLVRAFALIFFNVQVPFPEARCDGFTGATCCMFWAYLAVKISVVLSFLSCHVVRLQKVRVLAFRPIFALASDEDSIKIVLFVAICTCWIFATALESLFAKPATTIHPA